MDVGWEINWQPPQSVQWKENLEHAVQYLMPNTKLQIISSLKNRIWYKSQTCQYLCMWENIKNSSTLERIPQNLDTASGHEKKPTLQLNQWCTLEILEKVLCQFEEANSIHSSAKKQTNKTRSSKQQKETIDMSQDLRPQRRMDNVATPKNEVFCRCHQSHPQRKG